MTRVNVPVLLVIFSEVELIVALTVLLPSEIEFATKNVAGRILVALTLADAPF